MYFSACLSCTTFLRFDVKFDRRQRVSLASRPPVQFPSGCHPDTAGWSRWPGVEGGHWAGLGPLSSVHSLLSTVYCLLSSVYCLLYTDDFHCLVSIECWPLSAKKLLSAPFFDASGNKNINATIRIDREIWCLLYAGFFTVGSF